MKGKSNGTVTNDKLSVTSSVPEELVVGRKRGGAVDKYDRVAREIKNQTTERQYLPKIKKEEKQMKKNQKK